MSRRYGAQVRLEESVELLRELVEIESPTGDSKGIRAAGEVVARELAAAGADTSWTGDHLLAELPGRDAPLLLLGHLDTVWERGMLEEMPFRVENGRAHGPGAYDMKAGIVVMLGAIRQAGEGRRALRVVLTADEEIGSPTGAPVLEDAAPGVAAALVLEPPSAAGALKTARKGLGRYRLVVSGEAAHAGAGPDAGVSAVEELAHQILRLKSLEDRERGVTVNVGVVRGGIRENIVADHAEAWIDVRVRNAGDAACLDAALRALEPELQGTALRLEGGITRPPLERSPGAAALFAKAREHGRALGLDLRETASGGGSDGNLVGAFGIPVLDGLGAEGGGAHARNEHALVDSIPVRSSLVARLLVDPGL